MSAHATTRRSTAAPQQEGQQHRGVSDQVGLQVSQPGAEAKPLHEVAHEVGAVRPGIGIGQCRRQPVDLTLRPFKRDVLCQFGDDDRVVIVVVRSSGIQDVRKPDIRTVRPFLAGRTHDADHRDRHLRSPHDPRPDPYRLPRPHPDLRRNASARTFGSAPPSAVRPGRHRPRERSVRAPLAHRTSDGCRRSRTPRVRGWPSGSRGARRWRPGAGALRCLRTLRHARENEGTGRSMRPTPPPPRIPAPRCGQ